MLQQQSHFFVYIKRDFETQEKIQEITQWYKLIHFKTYFNIFIPS